MNLTAIFCCLLRLRTWPNFEVSLAVSTHQRCEATVRLCRSGAHLSTLIRFVSIDCTLLTHAHIHSSKFAFGEWSDGVNFFLDIEGPLVYRFAAISRGRGVQKLQFVINLSGSTGGDGFIECCRGSKRRIKEGVKSLSCK